MWAQPEKNMSYVPALRCSRAVAISRFLMLTLMPTSPSIAATAWVISSCFG